MAKINFTDTAGLLTSLYNDIMFVYRPTEEIDEHGITHRTKKLIIGDQECCAEPITEYDLPLSPNMAQDPQKNSLWVFCDSLLDIQKGDHVTIKRFLADEVYEQYAGFAGEPQKYQNHQEFKLTEKDYYTEFTEDGD